MEDAVPERIWKFRLNWSRREAAAHSAALEVAEKAFTALSSKSPPPIEVTDHAQDAPTTLTTR